MRKIIKAALAATALVLAAAPTASAAGMSSGHEASAPLATSAQPEPSELLTFVNGAHDETAESFLYFLQSDQFSFWNHNA
ncbi:hypothetical protein [Streptomyces sp. NPDC054849]